MKFCQIGLNYNMKNKTLIYKRIILAFGVIFRFIAFIVASPIKNQHDVMYKYGHFDYAMYIFENWSLPQQILRQFYHPPLNATFQAIFMKIISLFHNFRNNDVELYTTTKFLSLLYSLITLYIIVKIIDEFKLSSVCKNIIITVFSIYPAIIIMSTQYGNDGLAYMFFYLSLLYAIRWSKNHIISTIIKLALSIGFGMLSKISVGMIAIIIAPMMLVLLIKSNTKIKKTIFQLFIFAIIVFPIGLSFSIRNKIKYDIPIGYVFEIGKGSNIYINGSRAGISRRVLSLPLQRLELKKEGIYHDFSEYNIWVDLFKTSTFDEFNYGKDRFYLILKIIYFLNILFYIFGSITIIINLINIVLSIIRKNIDVNDSKTNLKIISIMLYFLAIISYILFNMKYTYSCSSNYRYIPYITFGLICSIVTFIDEYKKKKELV